MENAEIMETIDAPELARRYDSVLADRDRLAAENARLREALKDTAAQMKLLLDKARSFGRGHVYTNNAWKLHFRIVVADSDTALAAVDALLTDAARALVEAPR